AWREVQLTQSKPALHLSVAFWSLRPETYFIDSHHASLEVACPDIAIGQDCWRMSYRVSGLAPFQTSNQCLAHLDLSGGLAAPSAERASFGLRCSNRWSP